MRIVNFVFHDYGVGSNLIAAFLGGKPTNKAKASAFIYCRWQFTANCVTVAFGANRDFLLTINSAAVGVKLNGLHSTFKVGSVFAGAGATFGDGNNHIIIASKTSPAPAGKVVVFFGWTS